MQPLLVLLLAQPVLGTAIRPLAVLAAIFGMGGVALLVLSPEAGLDPWAIAAGLAGAVSMAAGTVLSRRWQPAVPPLTITAWQLAAGGLLLVPVTLVFAPFPMAVSAANLLGLGWLGLVGGALTYIVWFCGIGRVGPAAATSLGLLSPATAVLLGLVVQGETLSLMQAFGLLALVGSIVVSQWTLAEPGSSALGVRHPAAVDDSAGSAGVAIRKTT
ncbi:EamA family transporter [Roseomonas rosulenta]|uniref:EamA family transporter n=1 Tax=Roseomonas rosulenta TaxID=2748667 RepID=UPI0034E1A983